MIRQTPARARSTYAIPLVVVSLLAGTGVLLAQGPLPAAIQQFWNGLRQGAYAYTTLATNASGYHNFGTTLGSGGYGFRDNAGTMQYKDAGGSWIALPSGGVPSLPVTPAQGGTGITSYTIGDLIVASASTTLSKLADAAVGQVLISGGLGVAPSWSDAPVLTTSLTTPVVRGAAATILTLSTNAQALWTNSLGTAGVLYDFSTDGTVFYKTRAGTDAATVRASNGNFPNVIDSSTFRTAPTGELLWNGLTRITAPVDGQLRIKNNGNTAAVVVDVTTDGTAFVKSGAGADTAILKANTHTATGSMITPTVTITATAFASLGTPANGTVLYCNDCTIANPTAGSGNGAIVKRLNGVWVGN